MSADRDALPLVVLGSTTCEDTAIVRSRLEALRVPFEDAWIDRNAAARARVERLNEGNVVTPTLVFGDEAIVVAEPSLEQLGLLVAEAGHDLDRPEAVQFHGPLVERAIPLTELEAVGGGSFRLSGLRGSRQVALFLAHGPDCLACFGYARQLAARSDIGDADARAVSVVAGRPEAAAEWRTGIDASAVLAADPDGAWKRRVAAHVGARPDDAIVLVLDRYLAPRAGAFAPEAGGLITPAEVVEWLRFTLLDCPECSGELPWPRVDAEAD